MNFDVLTALKEKFKKLELLCEEFDEKGFWNKSNDFEETLRDVFGLEVAKFLMCLTASDGYVSSQELEMFNFLTPWEFDDAKEMIDTIRDMNVYNDDFFKTVPWIIEIMTKCENSLNSTEGYARYSVVNEFVDFFKLVGLTYINIDGELSEDEKQDYLEYVGMLDEYVDDNLIYK